MKLHALKWIRMTDLLLVASSIDSNSIINQNNSRKTDLLRCGYINMITWVSKTRNF